MGRPPKPPQLKILNGTHRKDRHGDAEVIMAEERIESVPTPPVEGEEFRIRWESYCTALISAGVLTNRDLGCVEALCRAHVMFKEAEDSLNEFGQYTQDKWGTVKPHPALVRREQSLTRILQFLSQLGLTPSARAKVAPIQQGGVPSKKVSKLRTEAQ